MRRRNEFWGWGVVVFFAGALVMVIIFTTQPQPVRYVTVLPENELEHQANQIAQQDGGMRNDLVLIDSAIVSFDQWETTRGLHSPWSGADFPVYVYRAYGSVKHTTSYDAEGYPHYFLQTVEISLDARTGISLGFIFKIPMDMTLDPLKPWAYIIEGTDEPLPDRSLATAMPRRTNHPRFIHPNVYLTWSITPVPTITLLLLETTSEVEYLETLSAIQTAEYALTYTP